MRPVILSGGSGSRLWPVSRESYPKQFCEFFDESFLRQTVERVTPFGEPLIVTLETMGALTAKALQGLGIPEKNLILEPLAKNTACAIALVARKLEMDGQADEVVGIFPADHLITKIDVFQKAIQTAETLAAQGEVVLLGVEPRYAATGYGYVEIDKAQPVETKKAKAFRVKRFTEKPSLEAAEEFVSKKVYFWNAGVFIFQAKTIIGLFQQYMPDLWKKISTLKPDFSNLKYVYANLIAQSIDYGVMEKMKSPVCIPGDFGWSDVGSWDELARLQEETVKIASDAQVFTEKAKENFVYANHHKVVGLCGVDNLIVVDTPDALLVAQKNSTQNVKNLVDAMRSARLPEVNEHRFEVRPWGRFEILSDAPDHKVKRLIIDPGSQLSYQMHAKRDEHWVVISGEAEVIMEDKSYMLGAGQQVFAPRGQKHRLRNRGKTPLVIVEVQTGQYFGEDDIVRFKDDYNRVPPGQ